MAFSLTAGPLAIVFDDGSALGLASEPGLASVIVWNERERGGPEAAGSMAGDAELYPVDAADETYAGEHWKAFLHARLTGLTVLWRRPANALEAELPCEAGLCFIFDDGQCFIAAHGLHDDSDDFSVLLPHQVAPAQRARLVEKRI